MRENCDFVVPVNILTTFARAPFFWAARHTTVCLDVTNVSHRCKRKTGRVNSHSDCTNLKVL